MKLKIVLYSLILMVLVSCGSSKKLSEKTKNSSVVLNEPKPEELASINENNFVKKLKKENPSLNSSKLAYIKKYAALAVNEMHKSKIPASITLAQGILESGSGKSLLASKSNNHFGIKCHSNWEGERVYHDDDEKGECFRKYQYVATSYKDHSEFLSKRNRYSFLFDYRLNDYKKWAKGLKKAGYATDKKYPDKLIHIIKTYKLYEFDKVKDTGVVDIIENESIENKDVEIIKPQNTIGNYYEVKKGDTLYSIARKFKTTVALIKEINGLKDTIISIGQHLLTK